MVLVFMMVMVLVMMLFLGERKVGNEPGVSPKSSHSFDKKNLSTNFVFVPFSHPIYAQFWREGEEGGGVKEWEGRGGQGKGEGKGGRVRKERVAEAKVRAGGRKPRGQREVRQGAKGKRRGRERREGRRE